MVCARCHGDLEPASRPPASRPPAMWFPGGAGRAEWCDACERVYDAWARRHATDIVWSALSGTVVVIAVALGIPLLGAPMIVATGGIFAGFATLFAVHRGIGRRRRAQFLRTGAMPRAYLR